ncbi:M3 family oligoendopeptidase [Rossellomorea vietnamensis]|uniref:M3 family oligoendopeptidase n=1 Tax=Rossellomorea vietnamensis TaxID=218284 RepID=A0A5D4KIM8_9BACI|nr:M3 family oligoendopeptidase [Rossellomorea vietnamensis]TYR77068.1 M3 family oligoendopeptidase [Rossellomorea vietnamensis]
MNFKNLNYQRPDIEEFERKVLQLLERFKDSDSHLEQFELIDQINSLRNDVLTMLTIAQIRSHLDTLDVKYQKEQQYINLNWPIYEKLVGLFHEHVSYSPFKKEIKEKFGEQLVCFAEASQNTVSSEVIEDLIKENNLVSDYTKLMATSTVEFRGEKRTLSQLESFLFSEDRSMRKQAGEKKYELLSHLENKIDRIFDELIKVRNSIAIKLGHDSFVELGYARLSRVGYGQSKVEEFRELILKYIVPISEKTRDKQRIRLGLDKLAFYDEDIRFSTGNPSPGGDVKFMVSKFEEILNEISLEAGEFFNSLSVNHLIDLLPKEGKARGAYATYLCNEKTPYIFANMNGTRKDIKVLSHEFGHAWQMYLYNQHNNIPEYILPTKEACEIHSISMEFLVWPYLEKIFGVDADKYRHAHLEDALYSMPYRAAIDEFQHFIYKNPSLSISERKEQWIEIEYKYMPYKGEYNHAYLMRGSYWQQQTHMFTTPFYYIDYALAQMCALQIWSNAQTNESMAWEAYMKLCNLGGSKSFLQLLDQSGINSPFIEQGFTLITDKIEKWLDLNENKINNDSHLTSSRPLFK